MIQHDGIMAPGPVIGIAIADYFYQADKVLNVLCILATRQSQLLVISICILSILFFATPFQTNAEESAPKIKTVAANAEPTGSRPLYPGRNARESSGLTNPEHIRVVSQCNKDISEFSQQGRYAEALAPAYKVLEITQNDLGPGNLEVAAALNNVGWVEQSIGDYVKARQQFNRALEIIEKALGPDCPKVATCLNNLASLSYFQGDYETALPLYERARAINEKCFGAEDPSVSAILKSIAGVLAAQGKKDEALAAYEKALKINEKALSADSEDLADSLNDYASALQERQRFSEAVPLLERALTIREKSFGPEHPAIAEALNNLAWDYQNEQQFDRAKPLLERALAISLKSVGPQHLNVANLLNNIAEIAWLQNDLPAAQDAVLKAAEIIDSHIRSLLPALSFAEQRAFLDTRIPVEVKRLLVCCRQGQPLARAYSLMFRWKGLLVDSLKRQVKSARLAEIKNCKPQLERLQKIRAEMAAWYLLAGTIPYQQWKTKNDKLTAEKESIERELADSTGSRSLEDALAAIDLKDFQKQLKADESVIDIYMYDLASPSGESEQHYGAVVTGSITSGVMPALVDLGPTLALDKAVERWRQEVVNYELAETSWQAVRKIVWTPLKAALPPGAARIWICPDGELSRIPFQLLPDSNNGKISMLIAQLDSPRELFQMHSNDSNERIVPTELQKQSGPRRPAQSLEETAPGPINVGGKPTLRGQVKADVDPDDLGPAKVLLLGNAAFDSKMIAPAHSGKLVKPPLLFETLPGTQRELSIIKEIAAKQGFATEELTGAQATKAALLAQLPRASYAHLATHGFFINQRTIEQIKSNATAGRLRSLEIKSRDAGANNNAAKRNPLLESGIVLAGANLRDPGSSDNPGLLTAEELIGQDFSRCRLMVLSACETGRGEETTGQGVLGLRASMIASGAKSVVMSIWKVPDLPTCKLMETFYHNLWEKHLPPSRALCEAQLETAKLLPPPLCWAGWVLVGQGW